MLPGVTNAFQNNKQCGKKCIQPNMNYDVTHAELHAGDSNF